MAEQKLLLGDSLLGKRHVRCRQAEHQQRNAAANFSASSHRKTQMFILAS